MGNVDYKVYYKLYLQMTWYLVYQRLLLHFQITILRHEKYGVHSADDIFKCILFNDIFRTFVQMSTKLLSMDAINK